MSQRGGEVVAHLRLADTPIYSPTIRKGMADIMFAFEPLEALRHLAWLAPDHGTVIASTTPTRNIPNYPDLETVLSQIRAVPRARLVDAERIAREAGNVRTANLVLVGAAMDLLPIPPKAIEAQIKAIFEKKGEAIIEANLKAFAAGSALLTTI